MTVRQKIALALASAFLTLLVGAVAVAAVLRGRTTTLEIDRTYSIINHLQGLIGALTDAETGQRGYLITGDSTYLEPYRAGRIAADSHLVALRPLVAGRVNQDRRFDSLERLERAKSAELEESIALRRQGGAAAARFVRTDRGKQLMDSARSIVAEMEASERRSLSAGQTQRLIWRRTLLLVIGIGTFGAFIVAFLSNRGIRRDVVAQQKAQVQIEEQSKQLQEQAVELEMANEQLQETTLRAEEARDAAEVASRAKSDFLAVMSHELRTPLNAIVGYAELLHDGVVGPVTLDQREQLQRVQLSAKHLVELVDEILSFTRLDAAPPSVRPGPVELAEVTREAGAIVEPVAWAKGLRFELHPSNEPVAFHSDAGKVRQVLVNLLSNAIKFTEQGEVELSSWPENGRVVFEVQDTGIGIAPEHLEHVFEPFWQADQSPTRKNGGAGLGLSVSRRLARALGGDLSVESTVGQGSRFRFWVPR